MGKILKKALWGLAGLLFISSIYLFINSSYNVAGIVLSACWVLLAIAMGITPKLKSFSFTVMILAAVTLSMTFPQLFVRWGNFPVKNLIVPLLQVITFGVGSTMSINDFKDVVKMPKGVFIGAACQFTIMPLVGFTIAKTFNFPPEIAAGIILVGSSPSGLASNVMAFIAKANLALSVTITATATLLAPVMTPLLMKLLGGAFVPVDFWGMLWNVMKILIIPIFLGVGFHHLFRGKISWLGKVMPKISMLGIALIIVVITAAGRDSLMIVGFTLIATMFLHMTIGFSLGYAFAKLFKMPEKNCRTVALEVGMQNGGLASGIAASMGKIATVGLAAAVNGPLMNTVFSIISTWWGGKETKKQFRAE